MIVTPNITRNGDTVKISYPNILKPPIKDYYIVANCGFDDLDEAWAFKVKMGFPDSVCSGNMFDL